MTKVHYVPGKIMYINRDLKSGKHGKLTNLNFISDELSHTSCISIVILDERERKFIISDEVQTQNDKKTSKTALAHKFTPVNSAFNVCTSRSFTKNVERFRCLC